MKTFMFELRGSHCFTVCADSLDKATRAAWLHVGENAAMWHGLFFVGVLA